MNRTRFASVAGVCVLLLLTGCSGEAPRPDPTSKSAPLVNCSDPTLTAQQHIEACTGKSVTQQQATAKGSPAPTVGSVVKTDIIHYPDGLALRITSVTTSPIDHKNWPSSKEGDIEVDVTAQLTNDGDIPIQLPDGARLDGTLYYGVNEYRATGWSNPQGPNSPSDLPKRLVPGTSAKVTFIYTLAPTDLATLEWEVNPDDTHYPDYTFTDVQTLIH